MRREKQLLFHFISVPQWFIYVIKKPFTSLIALIVCVCVLGGGGGGGIGGYQLYQANMS